MWSYTAAVVTLRSALGDQIVPRKLICLGQTWAEIALQTHIRDPTFHHVHRSNGQNMDKHSQLVKRTQKYTRMNHGYPWPRAFPFVVKKNQGFAAASGSDVCASQTLRLTVKLGAGSDLMELTTGKTILLPSNGPKIFVSFWAQSDGAYSKETPCCFSWHHVSLIWPDMQKVI